MIVEQVAFLMWTQVWQVAVLFVLVWSASLGFKKKRPHFALMLWILFFIKCLVPPIILAPVGIFAWQTPEPWPIEHVVATGQIELPRPNSDGKANMRVKPDMSTLQDADAPNFPGMNIILLVWCGGSVCFLMMSAMYFIRTRSKIYRSQRSLPAWIDELGGEVYSTTGINLLQNKLILTDASIGPIVLGFLRPVVVLPNQIVQSPELMRSVSAHEVCHIWRRDHWLSALQLTVQTMFWFHPLVWLASRETNRLCEVCCDDDTLRLFDLSNSVYARGLLDMLDHQRQLTRIHWSPGIRPSEITKERIEKILAGDVRIRFRRRYFALAAVLALMIFPAGGTSNWAIGFQGQREENSNDSFQFNSSFGVDYDRITDDAHRREMDFLLGDWTVKTKAGKEVGRSRFNKEPSGNMIREEWISSKGDTAQGVTYYDPNQKCWVLTWVDGSGTIMDSVGRWNGDLLDMKGVATMKDGTTARVRTLMLRESDSRVQMEMYVESADELKRVSQVFYCR